MQVRVVAPVGLRVVVPAQVRVVALVGLRVVVPARVRVVAPAGLRVAAAAGEEEGLARGERNLGGDEESSTGSERTL